MKEYTSKSRERKRVFKQVKIGFKFCLQRHFSKKRREFGPVPTRYL